MAQEAMTACIHDPTAEFAHSPSLREPPERAQPPGGQPMAASDNGRTTITDRNLTVSANRRQRQSRRRSCPGAVPGRVATSMAEDENPSSGYHYRPPRSPDRAHARRRVRPRAFAGGGVPGGGGGVPSADLCRAPDTRVRAAIPGRPMIGSAGPSTAEETAKQVLAGLSGGVAALSTHSSIKPSAPGGHRPHNWTFCALKRGALVSNARCILGIVRRALAW